MDYIVVSLVGIYIGVRLTKNVLIENISKKQQKIVLQQIKIDQIEIILKKAKTTKECHKITLEKIKELFPDIT